jgi:hypothetical protein
MIALQKMIQTALLIVFLFGSSTLIAQDQDPYAIIDKVREVSDQILDYSADVEIEVDVDFINVPIKHAQIFFKAPDKVKFKSDEFFMIPKRGFNNSFRNLLKSDYSAINVGMEKINDKDHYVVKIIPLDKKPDVIMATWWIDTSNYLISKIESNTRKDGTFTIDFTYGDPTIPLPSIMEISFEIEEMSLPLKFIGKNSNFDIDEEAEGTQSGRVFLRFSNYLVNTKLEDSIFEESEIN